MSRRDIDVIVTHYRDPERLLACLTSLEAAGVDTERVARTVVCDSAAQPTTGAVLGERFPHIEYIPFEQNVGFARLVNAGLLRTSSDFVLICNADTRVHPGALDRLAAAAAVPGVAVVGPRLSYADGSHQQSAFRFYRPATILARRTPFGRTSAGRRELARFEMRDVKETSEECEVDWMLAAAWMMNRNALERIGPFDERYFLYFEDVDWCRRAWNEGYRVIHVPTASVEHGLGRKSHSPGALASLQNRYTWIHIASARSYFWKHGWRLPKDVR